jgi:peptidoglycan biosynthesis protein MviN/MurJ (putative lipid II flippase)
METGEMVQLLLHQGLAVVPSLVGWTGAVVVAMILLRRGGEKAELLLLVGACLMLLATLLQIPAPAIPPLLVERGWPMRNAMQVVSWCSLGLGIMRLAGIACLLYAFWTRFEVSKALRQQA